MQTMIETNWQLDREYIDRKFATLNNNIRRFGGTIQGGLARHNQTERQAAAAEPTVQAGRMN